MNAVNFTTLWFRFWLGNSLTVSIFAPFWSFLLFLWHESCHNMHMQHIFFWTWLKYHFAVRLWPVTTLHQMSSESDTREMAKYCNIAFHQIEIYAPMRSMDSQSHLCYFTKVQVKLVRSKDFNFEEYDANCLWWWDLSHKNLFPAITNFYYSPYYFPYFEIVVISSRWSVIVCSYNAISGCLLQ